VRPLYDHDSLAGVLNSFAYAAWLVSEATILVRTVARVGPRAHMASYRGQDRLSGPALIGGIVLAVWIGSALAQVAPGAAMMAGRSFLFGFGFVLALAGVAFRWYAIITLGRFFSMRVQTASDQQVIESGPYRWIRHPSYTGGLMTVLGVLLMSSNWATLACFLIVIPGFAYRISVEERALVGELGDRYRSYMQRSKRLVPFLL
jgi:protein-S-isoprenylcysteine O-methyltransferase Ste14